MTGPGAILLKGGRLIDPASGTDAVLDVLLEEGRVARVAPSIDAGQGVRVLDVSGRWVTPGFIDLHVHLREPGQEHKETILTGSRAAVAGGFTGVVAMPNTAPTNDSRLVTELMLTRAQEADLCRLYPAGAITRGLEGKQLADHAELVDAGCVCITDDGHPVMSAGMMRRALQWAQQMSLPVMVHEEDLTLSHRGAMTEGAVATRLGLLPIPASAEVSMVARDLVLLEEVGGHLHLAHVSCRGTVELLRAARKKGLHVTAEVTPHHFVLDHAAVGDYDTHAKMNPPLRLPEDVRAIREAMADGTIDAIATDHAPHGPADKEVEFSRAMNGVVGLETALPLTLELVRDGVLTPKRAVELLSSRPAEIFRLPGGRLSVGDPADVTVVDPDAVWTVDAAAFHSKSMNTPFQGREVRGRVTHTVVGGKLKFLEGAVGADL